MNQPLVAITRGIPTHDDAPPVIAGCRVKLAPDEPQMTRAELLDFVRGATCVVTMFHDRVDAEFLDAAGPQLRGVCNFAVGVDNIDLKLCAARGVTVTNTPDAVTEGTANMAWSLILATARRLIEADAYARSGAWAKHGNGFPKGWMGMHLTGQTLVIVGAGRIGKAVALRGLAFGMRIAYVARSRKLEWELAPLAARRVTLEEGLALADVVSVHTPLTEQTRHLLNEKNLKLLKPSAIVINTARGPVIDEAALAKVLREKKIWGAGLDVFEHEPKVHPELVGLSNVVMSPHIGSSERKYRVMMGEMACADAGAIARGERAINVVHA